MKRFFWMTAVTSGLDWTGICLSMRQATMSPCIGTFTVKAIENNCNCKMLQDCISLLQEGQYDRQTVA